MLLAHLRHGPQQGRVILLGCQPSDGEQERRARRDARLLRRHLGGCVGQGVEAVPDRDELLGIVARRLEKAAHGIGDRDQPPGAAGEEPVDVPERPEQVAVVVVAGRDERDAERRGGDRSVHVSVDEMSVQHIGSLPPYRPDHVGRQPGADIGSAADLPGRHVAELRIQTRGVGAGDVEAQEARVDATFAQRGQESEQVAFGAPYARHLVHVEDLHASAPR
jgi:hypothetical protein